MEQPQQSTNRMAIGAKIALIGGSFFLPIAVLLFLMVGSMSSNIDFATKELAGNAYLRPLMAFQAAVQDYREAVMAGDTAVAGRARSSAEAALSGVDEQQARNGRLLQFTPEGLSKRGRDGMDAAGLRNAWNRLAAADPQKPDFGAAYTNLAATVRTVVTHAGDTSNLILDPDLDSYYLMDAVLVAAPQMQDRLASIYGLARAYTPGQDAGRLGLAVAAAMFEEADLSRLVASTETAINEDGNFYGVSPTMRSALSTALSEVREPAKRLLETARNGGNGPAIAALAHETRQAGMQNWQVASNELDILLRARIADYEGQRMRAVLISGLAVFAASLLAFFLWQSITQPLEKLVRSLAPGATLLTGCVEKIAEVTQQKEPDPAEAGIICEELNAHADDMRKAVLELALQVRGADAAELADAASGIRRA